MITDYKKLNEMLQLIEGGAVWTLTGGDENIAGCPNCYVLTVTKTIDGGSAEFLSTWMCGDEIIDKAWRYEELCD